MSEKERPLGSRENPLAAPPPMLPIDPGVSADGYEVAMKIPPMLARIKREKSEMVGTTDAIRNMANGYEYAEKRTPEESALLAELKAALVEIAGTLNAWEPEKSEPIAKLYGRAEWLAQNGSLQEAERVLVTAFTRMSLLSEKIERAYVAVRNSKRSEPAEVQPSPPKAAESERAPKAAESGAPAERTEPVKTSESTKAAPNPAVVEKRKPDAEPASEKPSKPESAKPAERAPALTADERVSSATIRRHSKEIEAIVAGLDPETGAKLRDWISDPTEANIERLQAFIGISGRGRTGVDGAFGSYTMRKLRAFAKARGVKLSENDRVAIETEAA